MDLIYEQMAARIRNLCDSGVDGIFVTIPADNVVEAVRRCHELRVPVVSVNSGKGASEELGLVHHIGQDEYSGGYGGAVRMIAAGMTRGCKCPVCWPSLWCLACSLTNHRAAFDFGPCQIVSTMRLEILR